MAKVSSKNRQSLVSNVPNAVDTTPVAPIAAVAGGPSAAMAESMPQGLAFSMPDAFEEPTVDVTPQSMIAHPYVKFFSRMAKDAGNVMGAIKNVQEGNPVLYLPDGSMYLLNPFRFFLLAAKQYWGAQNNQGDDMECSWEKKRGKNADGYAWRERVLMAMVVIVNDSCFPAVCTFKGPKCPCAAKASTTYELAKRPDWGTLSPDHAVTLSIPKAQYRFVTQATFRTDTGKESGNDYVTADGVCTPTTAAEITTLAEHFRDSEEFVNWLNEASESFKERLQQIAELVG